jgi:hypothetical protein
MDVGAILSRSLNLYRRNLIIILPHVVEYALDFLLIIVFFIIGVIVLFMVLGSLTPTSIMSLMTGPEPFILIVLAIFAIFVLFTFAMVLNAFAKAAVIGMVIEAEREGKTSLSTGIESAKRHGLSIFGYTLAISFIPAIAIGAVVTIVIVLAILAGEMVGGGMEFVAIAFSVFFGILGLLAYIVIYVMALFAPQKIVVEKLGVIDGIRASFAFVKKYPTEAVIYVGVAVAVVAATSIVSMIFAIPGIIFEYINELIAVFFTILENIVSIALGLIVAPYLKTVKTLMILEGDEKDEDEGSPVFNL